MQPMGFKGWRARFISIQLGNRASFGSSEIPLMKTSSVGVLCLALATVGLQAQTLATGNGAGQETVPGPTAYRVIDTGANHRVWQNETYEKGPEGKTYTRIHKFTELSAGLNYFKAGQWVEAKDQIEVFAGGAIARQGQSQVIFASNLKTAGAIDMQTPDGKRLTSNILGLMYVDTATGNAVQIASLQDSEGQLISDNEVVYRDAFEGVHANVKYRYTKSGFEQDVVLKSQLPDPQALGLNPETTVLEVFTEFINPSPAEVADVQAEDSTTEPDQAVNWGSVSLGLGKAFNLDGQDSPASVTKRYVKIQGRYFLLEKVRLRDIKSSLSKLPKLAANSAHSATMLAGNLVMPAPIQNKAQAKPMRLALGTMPDPGYVLDYFTLITSYTNYTFQSDNTYFINGTVNLAGTNVFEPGTVIKYATNGSITAVAGSKVVFQSKSYRPILFTSKDDNAPGEPISGSIGTPSGYYANPALNLGSMGAVVLGEFHISYAQKGLSVSGASPAIYDAQFVNCAQAFADVNGVITLENILFSNVKTNFNTTLNTNYISVQNATFNNTFDLVNGNYTNTFFYLTNCVFANVTNLSGNITAGNNGFYRSPQVGSATVTNTTNPFKVAGAASCYLTNGCAFLDFGTTNVDSNTLKLLAAKTVYAPVIFSNITISVATNFAPQASRDTNAPDLGYHYDPLDFVFGGVNVRSNMTFAAGTAVGWFELPSSYGNGYGISITNGKVVTFTGTVTSPCYFVRYSIVQEGGNGKWTDRSYPGGIVNQTVYDPGNIPTLRATFTRFLNVQAGSAHFRDGSSGQPLAVEATHCEILGAFGGYNVCGGYTNCLMDRVGFWQGTSSTFPYAIFRSCTFHGGSFGITHWEGSAPYWFSSVRNCAFDGTTTGVDDPFGTNAAYADYNYNAFLLGGNHLPSEGTNNVTVSNFNWQSSWFGDYYLPTNSVIINKGTTNANLLGFYHFTTQTNQTKETNSVIDIAYHYVATDDYGHPMDTDGDGIADYLEDVNGNGLYDAGDLSDWLLSPYNGLSPNNKIVVFTPLK